MAYQNVRGGTIPNLNYEYLDKLIADNSGFASGKIFKQIPIQDAFQPTPLMQPGMDQTGIVPQAKPAQNSILANSPSGTTANPNM